MNQRRSCTWNLEQEVNEGIGRGLKWFIFNRMTTCCFSYERGAATRFQMFVINRVVLSKMIVEYLLGGTLHICGLTRNILLKTENRLCKNHASN